MEREELKEHDRQRRIRNIIIQSFIALACFVWLCLILSKTYKEEKRVSNWTQVPCTIKSIKIDVEPMSQIANFFWVIIYEYEYDNNTYTSRVYNLVEKNKVIGGKEKEKIIKARQEKRKIPEPYSVNDKTVCFVNPDNPSESVLVREVRSKAFIKPLLAPGIAAVGTLIVLLHSIWNHIFYD